MIPRQACRRLPRCGRYSAPGPWAAGLSLGSGGQCQAVFGLLACVVGSEADDADGRRHTSARIVHCDAAIDACSDRSAAVRLSYLRAGFVSSDNQNLLGPSNLLASGKQNGQNRASDLQTNRSSIGQKPDPKSRVDLPHRRNRRNAGGYDDDLTQERDHGRPCGRGATECGHVAVALVPQLTAAWHRHHGRQVLRDR